MQGEREGRFISTFMDLMDSFLPNFQVTWISTEFHYVVVTGGSAKRAVVCGTQTSEPEPPGDLICLFWNSTILDPQSESSEGPPSHIQFVDLPVEAGILQGVRNTHRNTQKYLQIYSEIHRNTQIITAILWSALSGEALSLC